MLARRMFQRSVCLAFLVFGIGLSAAQTPYIDQKDLSITADTPPVHDATVGTLAGSAGTEGGAATYNIPIVVPPGRAGMQPSLALSYNSRGGDGVMGMGWSISGLSSIHRCPQTLEQDGQALGVAYAATDRLCLDGQRLVLASGTYGAAGATYKTEIDSYARITQVGGNLISTAACFRVEQKDGRILHYGAVTTGTPTATACAASSANARAQPTGAAATLSWLVEKIEDRPGNNQLYSYSNFGNGEVLPNVISYTGYGATAGDRSVTFAYQARSAAASGLTDVASSSYLAGGLTMQTKALLSVTTRVGTSVVRVVTPSYAASAYSGRLLVDSMQECAYSGATQACHPATQFESTSDGSSPAPQNFHLSPLALGVPGPQGLPPIDMTQSEATAERSALMRTMAPTTTDPDDGVTQLAQIAGDFDGDGTRETAMAVSRTDGQHDYVVQMTQDRQLHNAVEVTGILCYYWECYADFAGDGRSEAIVVPHSASDPAFIRLAAWTLPRGAVAQPGTNPFHLITTTIPSPIFPASNQPVGNVPRALDLNGDGRLDLVVQRTDAACGSDALGLKSGIYGYFNTVKINPTTHQIDESQPLFDSGRRLFCLNRTFTGNALTYNENIDHVGDFDGNGEPDFFVVDTRAFQSPSLVKVIGLQRSGSDVVALAAKSCTDIGLVSSGTALTDECQWSNGYAIRWMDVNGDGLDDFVIARPNEGVWKLRLNTGGHFGGVITTTGSGSQAGLDNYRNHTDANRYFFKYATRVPTMDVDGDGKPDLTVVSAQQGFAAKLCTVVLLPPQGSGEGCPITNDTSSPQCVAYACPQDPGTGAYTMPGIHLPDQIGRWNSNVVFPMYGSRAAAGTGIVNGYSTPDLGYADSSAYHLAAIRFVQTGPSAFEARLNETAMVSSLIEGGAVATSQDVFGDGLNDLVGHVGCQYAPYQLPWNGTTVNGCLVVDVAGYGPATLSIYATPASTATTTVATSTFATSSPFYINQNIGSTSPNSVAEEIASVMPTSYDESRNLAQSTLSIGLPDLPLKVFDGIGNYAAWALSNLSNPIVQGSVLPLYTVPATGGYADSRHYYFTSSMPVVTGMVQNNGAGDQFGFRAAVYGYTEAMYNHYGRGFQGFRTITSWLAALDTTRQTQTRTTYSQKFPLTGKTESIDVVVPPTSLGANPRLISRETDSWICNLANRGACPQGDSLATPTGSVVYAPVLDKQHAENHDLATGALVDHADTVNASATTSTTSGWDVYGNLRNQIVTRADDGTAIVSSHITRTTNLYPTDGTFTNCMLDVASWRIADLCQSTVISSIAYAAGHALPAGASAPVRTVAMTYQWNADRTPIARTIQPNVTDEQQTTNWTYPSPSYGLPNRMYISPARMTQFAYTKDGTSAAADGYFALTTTNALSQATTTEHSPRDGQVTRTIDPNQLKTVVTYDVFGRATKMDYQDASGGVLMPSLSIAYTRCTGGNPSTCPAGYAEDANQDWAAWRVTQVQAGSPTTVDWYDVLGRAVKHAERGFSGSFIASVTDYDEMNTVEQTSTPYFVGASIPYFTGWSYDRASRPTLKQSPGGDSDLVHTVLTSYSYSGHKTTVKVRGSGVSATCSASTNLCMDMSRTYDVLGRLEQTTQNNGATANYATTNYWYDGAGNAVAIQDAEANVITATYDNRGRRIGVVDPDAGSKTFTYNGLNELQTQTDARGVQTVFTYDALSRLRSRTATDNAAIAPLPKVIRDTWVFDPPGVNGGAGLLNYVKRETGPSTAAMTQVHIETDSYEQNTKRLSTQTQTLDGQASAWITGHGYDTNGREQTTTYPSGQVVKRGYTTYGELNQLSDNATGSVYWNATAKDAWGHLTGETYVGGLEGVHVTQPSTGQYLKMGWEPIGSPSASHRFDYLYDSFGNLTTQYATQVNFQTTETYAYDGLQRLKTATRTANVPGSPAAVTYQYGPSGNLWAKSDVSIAIVGGYQYGQNGCGPHAVSRVSYDLSGGAWTYQCDANGNVIGGNTLANGRYDFENRPWYIERLAGGGLPAGQATYMYGPSGDRFKEVTNTQTTWYGPAGFERTFTSPQTTDRIELGPVTLLKVGALASVRPNLKDRLGSTVAMGNSNGTLWQLRSYDAFGKPRNGDQSDRPTGTLDLMVPTLRGFTGHEHVDDLRLIHMNGRMYDPLLGRFLSVDPVIQFPSNSQSLNPYSYILNNPLAGSDPTGYQACTGSHVDRFDGSSCAGQGVSGGGSNSPDPMQQLSAKGMAVLANVWNQHVAAMTAKGDASKPTSGNPADIGANGRTTGDQASSQTLPTVTVTPGSDWVAEKYTNYPIYNAEYADWFDRAFSAWAYRDSMEFLKFQAHQAGIGTLCAVTAGGCLAYGAYGVGSDVEEGRYASAALGASFLLVGGTVGSVERAARPNAYSVMYETTIPRTGLGTRAAHKILANKNLTQAMAADKELGQMMLRNGVTPVGGSATPAGFRWHHGERPGSMQLVPEGQHYPGSDFQDVLHPGGSGGYANWGRDW